MTAKRSFPILGILALTLFQSLNICGATEPVRLESNFNQDWQFYRCDPPAAAAPRFVPPETYVVTNGTFPQGIAPQTVRCEPRTARYICLETLSSYQGPYASVAEFDLLDEQGKPLGRKGWKAAYADSEEVSSHDVAANAIDGDPQTKWHTQWADGAPGQPHTLVIDLGVPVRFAGFRYLPRQDGNTSGMTKDWKIFARTEPFDLPAPKDEASAPPGDVKWETVCLPHTAKVESPDVGGHYFRGGCWYRRVIAADPAWVGRRVSLQFDGAMQKTVIFVNGVRIGTHLGGYLPFVVDLTPYLAGHDRVTVALYLNNNASPDFPPGSNRIDFTYQGGLYRPARLVVTDSVHITNPIAANRVAGGGVFVRCESADAKNAMVLAQTHVRNDGAKSASVTVEHVLLAPNGRAVARMRIPAQRLAAGADAEFASTLPVTKPQLWHPNHPWLYTLLSTVKKDGQVCDVMRTRCGLRWLAVTDDGFFLNGETLVFRGANRHMSFPWLGNAASDNLQYRDIRLLKEGGFNFLRLCHYPQSQAVLDACDELGVMALVCTPGWQFWADNESFKREAKQNIRKMVRWYRNHPSAVLYEVSLNETYGHDDFHEECSNIAKAEYPGGQLLTSGDSYSAKRVRFYDVAYTGWGGSYNRPHHPDAKYKKSLHREYGDNDLGGSIHNLGRNNEKLEMNQAWNFQWAHNKNLSLPWTLGDAIWEGIDTPSAFGPSCCGPLDWYRLPKISYFFYQSQRDPTVKLSNCDSGPMVHIAGFWTARPSPVKTVVYSNAEEVELFLNGKSVGKRKPDDGPDAPHGTYSSNVDPMWIGQQDPAATTAEKDAAAKKNFQKSGEGRIFDRGNCRNLDHAPFTFVPVPYEPGELKAVAYIGGKVVATHTLRTPGKPTALRLRAATLGKPLCADGADTVFVYAEVLDAAGEIVPENKPVVQFKAEGEGRLVMPAASNAEEGIAPMMVQSSTASGIITVTATAEGLAPAVLDIHTANSGNQ